MATPNDVLRVAAGELGYCRWDDPESGTKYGRWFAQKVNNPVYAQNGIASCAMFVSWVFDKVGQSLACLPTAGCGQMLSRAKSAGLVLSNSRNAAPGDIVIFDWGYDNIGHDHVGIVELNKSRYLQTIEGNTTGADGRSGSVARRTRVFTNNPKGRPMIMAIIRPNYGGGSAPAPSPAPSGGIEVDGIWGEATTRRIQEVLNAPYKDGKISRQPKMWLPNHKGCGTGWEYAGNLGEEPGSQTISLIQKACGVAQDGFCGPDTINGIIRHFKSASGATVEDGIIDYPSITVKAMQHALNQGRF